MKKLTLMIAAAAITGHTALAQGTFLYDQQSTDGTTFLEGGAQFNDHPVQSFTPALTSIDFVTFFFQLVHPINATVNLRADSATGPILGTTMPLTTSAEFTGPATFYFLTPIALTPGTMYFLESAGDGGGSLNASPFYNYPGGALIGGNYDLWFREGVTVPEPTIASLALLGGALALRKRRLVTRRSRPS